MTETEINIKIKALQEKRRLGIQAAVIEMLPDFEIETYEKLYKRWPAFARQVKYDFDQVQSAKFSIWKTSLFVLKELRVEKFIETLALLRIQLTAWLDGRVFYKELEDEIQSLQDELYRMRRKTKNIQENEERRRSHDSEPSAMWVAGEPSAWVAREPFIGGGGTFDGGGASGSWEAPPQTLTTSSIIATDDSLGAFS